MAKTIPDDLKNVPNLMTKMVNYVKSRALEKILPKKYCCEEENNHYETLVLHYEIEWIL